MRRAVIRVTIAAGLMVALFSFGLACFTLAVERDEPPPPRADGIVVLTGGAERIGMAVRLLQAGAADRLLISGVPHGTSLQQVVRPLGIDAALLAERVTLGFTATSTHGNAVEAAEWARSVGLGSMIVVTARYHMPRALLELSRTMPNMALYPVPVSSPAMHRLGLLRLLTSEYGKYLAVLCGVQRGAELAVDKFVNR